MGDLNTNEEYVARFKNLRFNIIKSGGKTKSDLEYVSIVLDNLSLAFKSFCIL